MSDDPNVQMLNEEIAGWKTKAEDWKANALAHWKTIEALQRWVMENGGDGLWVPGTTLDQSLIAHLNAEQDKTLRLTVLMHLFKMLDPSSPTYAEEHRLAMVCFADLTGTYQSC